jgi:predicted Zn-dependent protease
MVRAAGTEAGLMRVTLIPARAINAFVTSGNRC